MIKKILTVLILLAFAHAATLGAESQDDELFSLHLIPGATIPLGTDADSFTIGGAATLLARLPVPGIQLVSIEGGVGYGMTPLKVAASQPFDAALMNLVSGRIGFGLRYPFADNFTVGAHVHGGYYFGFLSVDIPFNSGNNPLLDAGIELKYRLGPYFSLGIDASYRWFFGLSSDVFVGLGVSYIFPVGSRGKFISPQSKPYPELELLNITFNDVFPVFYKYYSDHPMGRIEIRNNGKIPIENVKVKLFVAQYMDNPSVCKEFPFITGGAKEAVDLYSLFNDKMLSITENTKVQISISVESTVAGEKYGNEIVQNLRVYDRNAMTWEDDRRAAAFVSIKDPTVLKFAKNVSSSIKDKASKAINQNFLTALAYFEALRLYGMTYAVDPTTPFTEFSKKKSAVDFLQFPNQTLDYKAGDCDDLSILYCALLESVGIKSAFVTTPGHIFVAVSLGLSPAEARRQFAVSTDFIFKGDDTWLPVEITALSRGFLDAWQSGIKLWREEDQSKRASMIVLRDAWETYEPVGFTRDTLSISIPNEDQVVSAYLAEVMKYIDRDLYPQTQKLEKKIKDDPSNVGLVNNLGVLYARYGVYDKAEAVFNRILKNREYVPALVNMGNVYYLKKDMNGAKTYYEKAYKKEPTNPSVLLNLAKVNYELGKYDDTEKFYALLAKQDKGMAGKFNYLSMKGSKDTARAADVERMKEVMVWDE